MLETLESHGSVKYVLTGQFAEPSLVLVFDHGKNIPNLGRATSETGNSSESFLVCKPELQIIPEAARVSGQQRFFINQLHNPNTVTFTPAGMWNEEIVLAGRVGTASDSQESQRLMKQFHSVIKRRFVKINALGWAPGSRIPAEWQTTDNCRAIAARIRPHSFLADYHSIIP